MSAHTALSPGSRTRVIDSDMSTGSDSVATGSDSGATGSDRSDYSGSVCSDDHDEETTSEPRLAREGSRKLIKPDFSALSQLLNFDEEEEDDLEDEELEDYNAPSETAPSPTEWHKTVVKDLTSSTNDRCLDRRHSITVCESPSRRKSSSASSSSSCSAASPKSSLFHKDSLVCKKSVDSRGSPEYQLNTSQMHASLQDEFNSSDQWHKALQTLNLNLEEVAHIRSVLTKADLEALPLDGNVKENVQRGRICFLCMKTKFGIFIRGQKCDMCKQMICTKCHTKMRVPVEQFSATPVFTLSPTNSTHDPHTVQSKDPKVPLSRLGVPELAGISNSAGSAPSSPGSERRRPEEVDHPSPPVSPPPQLVPATVNTISHSLDTASLPVISQYATLPKKSSRRWSLIQSRSVARERLEGNLLTVCFDCKEMVLQVIRTSRTTKKMQVARSVFFGNISAVSNNHREHRV